MTKKEREAYNYFIQEYHRLKNLNQPYRNQFNDYIEYYRGYVDKTRYPMAYNYSYNKILPIILRELESMMGHLYRGGDVVAVRPRSKADIQAAERVGDILNFQMDNLNGLDSQGGSFWVMINWILSALIFGKGVVKAYWMREEGPSPIRQVQRVPVVWWDTANRPHIVDYEYKDIIVDQVGTIYNGPYIENIPIRQFLPDPEYKDIQKMPCAAHVFKQSVDWIKKNVDKGVYNKKAMKELGKLAGMVRGAQSDLTEFNSKILEIESASTLEEIATDYHTAQNIPIIDCYGKYSLSGPVIDVDRGVTFKGKEEEVVCTIANYDTILRLEPTPYGIKPFFDVGAHINPDRYYDMGVVELVKDIQEAYNVLANLRLQVVNSKINPMMQVLVDSDLDPRFLVFKPFGFIPVTSHDDIKILESADFGQGTFSSHMNFFDNIIAEMTGVHPYSMGQTPPRQEHVGTMYSLQQMGQSRMRLLMMTMDHTGFRPLLQYIMKMNVMNLPTGQEYRVTNRDEEYAFNQVWGEDIHTNYDLSARYVSMEPALDKPFRINQLLQLSQTWSQDPSVNQYQFKRAIMELMEMMEPDRMLYTEEEVQRKSQAGMHQGYQEEIVRAKWEANEKGKTRQHDMVMGLLKGK